LKKSRSRSPGQQLDSSTLTRSDCWTVINCRNCPCNPARNQPKARIVQSRRGTDKKNSSTFDTLLSSQGSDAHPQPHRFTGTTTGAHPHYIAVFHQVKPSSVTMQRYVFPRPVSGSP